MADAYKILPHQAPPAYWHRDLYLQLQTLFPPRKYLPCFGLCLYFGTKNLSNEGIKGWERVESSSFLKKSTGRLSYINRSTVVVLVLFFAAPLLCNVIMVRPYLLFQQEKSLFNGMGTRDRPTLNKDWWNQPLGTPISRYNPRGYLVRIVILIWHIVDTNCEVWPCLLILG